MMLKPKAAPEKASSVPERNLTVYGPEDGSGSGNGDPNGTPIQ